ncbi:MAG: hypothetical protein AB7Q37_03590 [Pyrinomonadaceae bacterium]
MIGVKKAALAILAAALAYSADAQTPKASEYIGYRYQVPEILGKLQNGFTHRGGGLIGDINADPVLGVSTLEKGRTMMFWLEVSIARDENGGVTAWEVKDVLEFPNVAAADRVLEFSDPSFECTRGRRVESELIGIGRLDRRRGIFTPRKLWRPNARTAKFETVSVQNVRCLYSEP